MSDALIKFALLGLLAGLSQKTVDASEDTKRLVVFGESLLRLETVSDGQVEDDGVGLTLLVRPAVELRPLENLTAIIEGEFIFALQDDYDDGRGVKPNRPLIADPEGAELNRLQIQYKPSPHTFITLGRQKLSIDDERFIGAASFRQNDQTFDGVHFASEILSSATLQIGYFNRVNRILGEENPQGVFEGDSFYANLNLPVAGARLGVFHYAFDLSTGEDALTSNAASSATTGLRLEGRMHRDPYGVDWEAAIARQTEYGDNPATFDLDYYVISASGFAGPATLSVRYEVFEGNDEQAFQTPLGTQHAFQGEADIFTTTPASGLRDLEIKTAWNFGRVAPFRNVSAFAAFHDFVAETDRAELGQEFNAQIRGTFGRSAITFKAAHYSAEAFAADTTRFFLSYSKRF